MTISAQENPAVRGTAQVRKAAKERPSAKPKGSVMIRELMSLIIKIILIMVAFILIFTMLYGFHRTDEPDMAPMIRDGDLVLFYRLDNKYEIDDVVLLDVDGKRQARRVVAMAGDVVDITGGELVVNGSVQQEPRIYKKTERYEKGVSFPLTVGKGQLFVLGDARENAEDSRIYGPVKASDVVGKAITVIRRRNI